MSRLDKDPSIVEWSSEEHVIPYRSPIDNRMHRYFVDFYIKKKMPDGKTRVALIEIKPKAQVFVLDRFQRVLKVHVIGFVKQPVQCVM